MPEPSSCAVIGFANDVACHILIEVIQIRYVAERYQLSDIYHHHIIVQNSTTCAENLVHIRKFFTFFS